jgi:hypothetical protein
MKIEQEGFIAKGKLFIDDRGALNEKVSHAPDMPVMVTIERFTGRKTKRQGGYYWSTLVPHTLIILRDICGYREYESKEQAHEFLKYAFNPRFAPDPETQEQLRMPGSTKRMSKERKMKYIDDIIMWGWEKFQYTYPPPRKGEKKYQFD